MMTMRMVLVVTTVLLGWMPFQPNSWAQAPSGSITNQIVGTTNALWDARLLFPDLTNDTWAGDLSAFAAKATNDAVSVGFGAPYTLDGRGRLSGSGTNEFTLRLKVMTADIVTNWFEQVTTNADNQEVTNTIPVVVTNAPSWKELTNLGSFPGTYVARGSVVGMNGGAIVRLRTQEFGQVPWHEGTHQMSVTKAEYVVITAKDSSMVRGSEASIIRFSGQRSYAMGNQIFAFNPFKTAFGGGWWTLVLNFDAPSGTATNRLSGNATVTLSSDNVYPFHFTGRYSPKTGQSSLLLTGVANTSDTQDGRGSHLSVTLTNGAIKYMVGRVAGQVVKQK